MFGVATSAVQKYSLEASAVERLKLSEIWRECVQVVENR
jgi:hypothetical protein